jgi:hypothetical protein
VRRGKEIEIGSGVCVGELMAEGILVVVVCVWSVRGFRFLVF